MKLHEPVHSFDEVIGDVSLVEELVVITNHDTNVIKMNNRIHNVILKEARKRQREKPYFWV